MCLSFPLLVDSLRPVAPYLLLGLAAAVLVTGLVWDIVNS